MSYKVISVILFIEAITYVIAGIKLTISETKFRNSLHELEHLLEDMINNFKDK
jgi:hypothetical protein